MDISVEAESNADTAQLPSLTIQMQVVNVTFGSIDLFSYALEENRVSRLYWCTYPLKFRLVLG